MKNTVNFVLQSTKGFAVGDIFATLSPAILDKYVEENIGKGYPMGTHSTAKGSFFGGAVEEGPIKVTGAKKAQMEVSSGAFGIMPLELGKPTRGNGEVVIKSPSTAFVRYTPDDNRFDIYIEPVEGEPVELQVTAAS